MGFFLMGFIGFFVKLIHIPINNIIVYVQPSSALLIIKKISPLAFITADHHNTFFTMPGLLN